MRASRPFQNKDCICWSNHGSHARTPPDLDFYVRLHYRFASLCIVLELLKGRAKAQHYHSFLLGAGGASPRARLNTPDGKTTEWKSQVISGAAKSARFSMMIRCISLVPSPITRSGASR